MFQVGQIVRIDLIDSSFERNQSVCVQIVAVHSLKSEVNYYVSVPPRLRPYAANAEEMSDVDLHFSVNTENGYTCLFAGFDVQVTVVS